MQYTESEVTEFITDNDVKFIKMAFCDIFGRQKIIAIQPSLLASAFEGGIPIDASRIMGFEKEADSELFLVPDTSTMSLLPWRPAHGRVVRFFCDIRRSDGTGFDIDCRGILKKAVDIAKLHGIIFEFGARNEFYLFKNDENGNATAIPFDNAGFMDAAPEDKGEDVRRERHIGALMAGIAICAIVLLAFSAYSLVRGLLAGTALTQITTALNIGHIICFIAVLAGTRFFVMGDKQPEYNDPKKARTRMQLVGFLFIVAFLALLVAIFADVPVVLTVPSLYLFVIALVLLLLWKLSGKL